MKSKELGALGKGLRALWERNKFVLLVIAAGAALLLLPALPGDDIRLSFDAICSEDGSECETVIRWQGTPFDPLTQGDALSVRLALAWTKDSRYAFADGVNTVTIRF